MIVCIRSLRSGRLCNAISIVYCRHSRAERRVLCVDFQYNLLINKRSVSRHYINHKMCLRYCWRSITKWMKGYIVLETDGWQEGFRLQRRNLVVMSTVILFCAITKADFTRLAVLGNELHLTSPDGVRWFLLSLLAYFLWRYDQYRRELKGQRFSVMVQENIAERSKCAATREFQEQYPLTSDTEMRHVYALFNKGSWLKLECQVVEQKVPDLVHGEYSEQKEHLHSFSMIESVRIQVSEWCKFYFGRYFFSEYGFPYLLAAISPWSVVALN